MLNPDKETEDDYRRSVRREWRNYLRRSRSYWLGFASMFILFGVTFPPLLRTWPQNETFTWVLLGVWGVVTGFVTAQAVRYTIRANRWFQFVQLTQDPSDEEIQRIADEAEQGYDPERLVAVPAPAEAFHAKQFRWWLYWFVGMLCTFVIYWPASYAYSGPDWRFIVALAIAAIVCLLGAHYHNGRVRQYQTARVERLHAQLAVDGLMPCEHHEGGEHVRPERMDS